MKSKSSKWTARWQMIGLAVLFLVAGGGLIFLSSLSLRPLEGGADGGEGPAASGPAASAPAASAPASEAPTTAPAEPGPSSPGDQRKVAAESMSGMLLLLGLVGIGFGLICAGWVVYDVYRSRPAWKTQTKYPVRRRRR